MKSFLVKNMCFEVKNTGEHCIYKKSPENGLTEISVSWPLLVVFVITSVLPVYHLQSCTIFVRL